MKCYTDVSTQYCGTYLNHSLHVSGCFVCMQYGLCESSLRCIDTVVWTHYVPRLYDLFAQSNGTDVLDKYCA